jgi:hypothetical protein
MPDGFKYHTFTSVALFCHPMNSTFLCLRKQKGGGKKIKYQQSTGNPHQAVNQETSKAVPETAEMKTMRLFLTTV